MGVIVRSKNFSINLGYNGFNQLRTKIAELTAPDIFEHYKLLKDGMYLSGEEQDAFFVEYNKKINKISDKYNNKYNYILNFLYEADYSVELSVEHCKAVYEVIKDYDDNVHYGYIGRPDCTMFKDFKKIIKDCIDNNCNIEWF